MAAKKPKPAAEQETFYIPGVPFPVTGPKSSWWTPAEPPLLDDGQKLFLRAMGGDVGAVEAVRLRKAAALAQSHTSVKPAAEAKRKRTRGPTTTTKAVIRCFQKGMTDTDDIAIEAETSVGNVRQVKSRHPNDCKPQQRKKRDTA